MDASSHSARSDTTVRGCEARDVGAVTDVYRHHGIDTQAIIAAAQSLVPGRPIRHLRALG